MEIKRRKMSREELDELKFRPRGNSWMSKALKTWRRFDKPVNILTQFFILLAWIIFFMTFPFSLLAGIRIAKEYERAVIFRMGRLQKDEWIYSGVKGPGVFFVLPCIESWKMIDLRVLSFDVPAQEILSKDSVTVTVTAVVYFKVLDPITAIVNVNDVESSTKLLSQSTLRNILGTKTLSQMLAERDPIAHSIQKMLDVATAPWGVKVIRVEVKDILLPQNLLRIMAVEAEAEREANARLIHAHGEERAAKSMVEAAEILGRNPVAFTLRYFQALRAYAKETESTVIFPLPTELPNWKEELKGLGKFDEEHYLKQLSSLSFQEGDLVL